jgi:hypothetical protein
MTARTIGEAARLRPRSSGGFDLLADDDEGEMREAAE